MPWTVQWHTRHSMLRLACCFGAFFNKLLEQNQGYRVLVSSVRGRRSLMVASTSVWRVRDMSSLVLL